MSFGTNRPDPEDMFAETRMTFGEHIEELRKHLIRAIAGFLIALILSLFVGQPVLEFIAAPVEHELVSFYNKRAREVLDKLKDDSDSRLRDLNQPTDFTRHTFLRDQLQAALRGRPASEVNAFPKPKTDPKEEPEDAPVIGEDQLYRLWTRVDEPLRDAAYSQKAQMEVGRRPTLSTLTVTEAFVVYFKVCIYCGIVLASPWIFYQLWSFVAAGLYPHERRYVNLYLPVSLGLFLAGVALCEFVVIPKAVQYLLSFNEWIGLEPDLRLSEWLSFAIMMPLVFGAAFQTPLIMLFLERIGLMSVDTYRKHRRIAMFLMAVVAVILSASPDAFSMLSLTIPLWALYELGILMCRLSPRRAPLDLDVPEPEEMVEV